MRVWDVHPGYLSRTRLLGHHAEIHAIHSILSKGKSGYRHHPETERWLKHLPALRRVHDLVVAEMFLRGYAHRSPLSGERAWAPHFPKYLEDPGVQLMRLKDKYQDGEVGRIPLPKRKTELWAHHKYQVMTRGYQVYRAVQTHFRHHPDERLEVDARLVKGLIDQIRRPPCPPGFRTTRDHLWGYVSGSASAKEAATYREKRDHPADVWAYLFQLASRYDVVYLLHQTCFAEIFPDTMTFVSPSSNGSDTP